MLSNFLWYSHSIKEGVVFDDEYFMDKMFTALTL